MSETLDWNAKTIAEFRANEGTHQPGLVLQLDRRR